MKQIATTLLLAAVMAACSSTSKGLFGKKTPHEAYAEKLDDQNLDKTPAGRQWLAASTSALENGQPIQLPYQQQGFFANDKPRALGLKFTAKKGQRLTFHLQKKKGFVLYADLFKEQGDKTLLLHAADTATTSFSFDIDEPGSFVLRLQPPLMVAGSYTLSISIGPSLGFPVSGNKAKAGSFWGASRGGGKRTHEGVDIFAPKRTPVVAAADGVVTGVKEGGIGGKVIWLKLDQKEVTLYYAHLDKQLVHEGQAVKKGETLGLVGNTGNAKNTPSHLHFGAYTMQGPIDPFPFIDTEIKSAPPVPEKNLAYYLQFIKTRDRDDQAPPANYLLVPLALNAKGYFVEMPAGQLAFMPFGMVKVSNRPIKKEEVIAGKPTGTRGRKIM